MEKVQREAVTQSVKFHEAIKTYDTTSSILEGDIESNNNKILTQAEVIEKLPKAVEQQSATIETIQEVHKVDSARIQTVEAVVLSNIVPYLHVSYYRYTRLCRFMHFTRAKTLCYFLHG